MTWSFATCTWLAKDEKSYAAAAPYSRQAVELFSGAAVEPASPRS